MTTVPEKSTDGRAILLDFSHITDPRRLFYVLVLFRHHRDCLHVAEENLTLELEVPATTRFWNGTSIQGLHQERFHLLDESLLDCLAHYQNVDDLTASEANLGLAVRLLQHSVKQGHIRVLSQSEVSDTVKLPPELESFPESRRYGELLVARENPWAFGADLRLAVALNLSYVTVDALHIASAGYAEALDLSLVEPEQGVFRQTLEVWQPRSLHDFLVAIDHPRILGEVAEAVEEVIDANQYRKDLLLFAPRFLADLVTGGGASVLEMLYRIYRRRRRKQ